MRALLATVAAAVLLLGPAATPVAAEGGGGASSRVVGRGDIVTSIIGWRTGRGSPGRGGTSAPPCRWVTLQDAQIEWLAAVSASSAALGGPTPVLDSVRQHLAAEELPDGDLQARVCGAETVDVRFVARTAPLGTLELLQRRMITRLPVPRPHFSPPGGVAVPLHSPVFVSIPEPQWADIDNTITADGVTAQVRARPIGMRVISGDPTGEALPCPGPARPFDPASPTPVHEQAAHPATCTIAYRAASPRGAAWIGTVTVLWQAEWRSEGSTWQSLGVIPRTRLFDRPAREVRTAIESTRRR